MKNLQHGGDLDTIARYFNISKNNIIDFSANINPLGISKKIKKILIQNLDVIQTYPDKDYINLKNSISLYTKTHLSNIVIGNGATEIISIFLKIISPKKSVIISPAYSEYENELKKINSNIIYFKLEEKNNFKLDIYKFLNSIKNVNIIILCNPNNPTGTALNINELEEIAKYCQNKNIHLMIDETYTEFTDFKDNISAIPLLEKFKNIFVVRGTSKFFSIPGIRLGYGLSSNKDILNKINYEKNPWSVNSIANLIGINIFNDIDFIKESQNLIFNEREYLFKNLSKINNLKYYDSKSNFILCKILNDKNSDFIFNQLIKKNILIRNAKNFQFLNDKFFRFCILKNNQNKLLLENLKIFLK